MDAIRSGLFAVWCSLVVLVAFATSGCGSEVTSPTPKLKGKVGATNPGKAVVYPGFRCNTQQSSWVTLRGENFTPMVVDVLQEEGQKVRWPRVRITRVQNLKGKAVDEEASVVVQTDGTIVADQPSGGMETMINALDGGLTDAGPADTASETGVDATAGDVGADATNFDAGADDASHTDVGADTGPTIDAGGDTGRDTGEMSPDVAADGGSGDAGADDDTGMADAGADEDESERHLVWLDETRLRFKITPEMQLEPGLYDVTVISSRVPSDGAAKGVTSEKSLGILGRPVVEQVEAKPLCLAQAERQLTISGGNFLRRGDETPTIRIGPETYQPDTIADESCTTPGRPFGPYEVCGELTVTVPKGAFGPGSHHVQVENFDPASCQSLPREDGSSFRVVEPPKVDDLQPDPVCSRQTSYEPVAITGENFLKVGESLPSVEIGEFRPSSISMADCKTVEGNVPEGTERCTTIEATVPAGSLPTGDDVEQTTHAVQVTNPGAANCTTGSQVTVTSIDPPVVESVGPQPIIGAQTGDRLTITGRRFAIVDGQPPTVHLGEGDARRSYTPTAVEGCREVKGPDERRVNLCSRLEIELAEGDFTAESGRSEVPIVVENPSPLGCTTRRSGEDGPVVPEEQPELTVLDAPSLTGVAPSPICTKQGARTVEISGEDLFRVEGRTPTISVGMQSYQTSVPEEVTCQPVDHDGSLQVERCPKLTVEIAPSQFQATHQVVLYNPEPVGGYTTESGEAAELQVVDRPRIKRVSPVLTCLADGGRSVEIAGQGFIALEATGPTGTEARPTVSLGQVNAQASVETVSGCETIDQWPATNVKRCQRLEVTLTGSDVGLAELTVTNPMPVGCSTTKSRTVRIDPAPMVSSATPSPQATCNNGSFRRVVVSGTKFLSVAGQLPEVRIGSKSYQPRAANGCTEVPGSGERRLEYCDELIIYPTTSELAESRQLSVHNPMPSGCSSGEATVQSCP